MSAPPEKKGPEQSEGPVECFGIGPDLQSTANEVNALPLPNELPATPTPPVAVLRKRLRGATVFHTQKTKQSRFARIDNAVLQSSVLSFRARGVLAYILSKPDDWCHSAEGLASDSTEGLHAIRSALRELSDAGYARLEKARDQGGHWASRWMFRESPNTEKRDSADTPPNAENQYSVSVPPSAGFPRVGQPDSGKPDFGKPNAGKSAPSETTVGETTVNQTTLPKRERVARTLEDLKSQFTEIDVDAQWKAYRHKYPHGGISHFAEHWMPRAEPTIPSGRHATSAPAEPKAWQDFVKNHYAKECTLWQKQWHELDRIQQQEITRAIASEPKGK